MSTWKELFCRQVSTGKFWKELFKNDFDDHDFLDRSDALYICKEAQKEIYKKIIKKFNNKLDVSIIDEFKKDLEDLSNMDDSALGMKYYDGEKLKQIKN